ncbi:hypothetical protein OIY81_1807 [Cryptosporidium canis]|uniref:Uncharacterized protein n=1 Tax=Cryptosporidium canis TaxID=195482 RepID=A0ABQ8P9Q3_9CRYT|nr:hypothetical protein OIY81_1807 [Cryptosporidium canis]KAJ1613692.1 hypothetical protein OJ252_885 [Cryptosporidium canis]
MARKRRYGSALGGDEITESPFLESINLPDENYYRNMTESPMELDQPHISTNPVKHGLSRANVNNAMIMQDMYNKSIGERVVPKVRRKRTLIPQDVANHGNDTDHFRRELYPEDVDIFQDDLSQINHQTNRISNNNSKNTFAYNTRSKAMSTRQDNTNALNKPTENSLRKKAEKGSSNLPPLPRTEDYWPKVNRDTTKDHEEYLNNIRNQHFSRLKENENMRNVNNVDLSNHFSGNQGRASNIHEGVYSIETPLKSFRSEMMRPMNHRLLYEREANDANGIGEYNRRYNDIIHENGRVIDHSVFNKSHFESHHERSSVSHNTAAQKQTYQKGMRTRCDAMVGGDTPLRDIPLHEDSGDDTSYLADVKTSEVGVGPSPKNSASMKVSEEVGSERVVGSKQRTTGSILRKSVEASDDNSKQVRFSSKKSKAGQAEEKFPEVEDLRFDPSEVPLVDYQDYDYRFDTLDIDQEGTSNVIIDEDKMLDTLSVDSNICLRLVQLSKEEIKLFEKAIQSRSNEETQNDLENSMDDELMIKAVSGIHKYFLNKAFEYESRKEPELRDMISWTTDVNINEDRHQSVSSEREELINKIGILNLNINKLTNALQEAEELKSKLFSPLAENSQEGENDEQTRSKELEYIFKCTDMILSQLESTSANCEPGSPKVHSEIDDGDQKNSDADKSDTSYLCSPTPVMPCDENNPELDSVNDLESKRAEVDIDGLLNECHQSQFIQMESIAVLNDCMSLLDDAEVGMQNFQRLLAKKAFDTNEESDHSHAGFSPSGDSMEVVEDALLRLQRGVSVTPRFSLEGGVNYRSSVGSRKSIGGKT